MEKFIAENFDMGHGSERYVRYDGRFVARFKYARPGTNARAFVKFLIANFTVEEYFAALKGGTSPYVILEAKGYVSPNVQRAIKALAKSPELRVMAR